MLVPVVVVSEVVAVAPAVVVVSLLLSLLSPQMALAAVEAIELIVSMVVAKVLYR